MCQSGNNQFGPIAENPETAAFAKASRVDIEEDDKPSFSDGEEEESQPVVEDEYAEDDEDDEETDGTTFAETVAAMKVLIYPCILFHTHTVYVNKLILVHCSNLLSMKKKPL